MKTWRSAALHWAPLWVLCVLLAPSSAALQDVPTDPTTDAQRAAWAGTWQLATPTEQAATAIDRAAERAANALNYFIRPVARTRLREGTSLHTEIELSFDGEGRLTVRFGDGDRYTTRIGATERRRDRHGRDLRVTQRFRPTGELEQVFETDSGTRWYVWVPTGDRRVRLEVTTGSPQLPEAMRFSLDYRKR